VGWPVQHEAARRTVDEFAGHLTEYGLLNDGQNSQDDEQG
jgi:hypothetical protein